MKRNQQKKKAASKAAEPPKTCELCYGIDWEAERTGNKIEITTERDYAQDGSFRGWLCPPCKGNVLRFEAGLICFSACGIELYLKSRRENGNPTLWAL